MAKGGSESAAVGLACQKVAGEYRRAVADAPSRRRRGYWGSRPSCTGGQPMIASRRFDDLFNLVCDPAFLLVGWRRVRGNKGARSAGVDGQTAYTSSGAGRGGVPRRASGRPEGPAVSAHARTGADDPQARWQQAPAWDPDRAGPGGASRPEAGAGADLGGGLPTLLAMGSVPDAAPRTPSPRSTS